MIGLGPATVGLGPWTARLAAATVTLAALGAALPVAPAAAVGTPDDPVRLTVSAPAVAALDTVPVEVTVNSDPGAFDIAEAPVRLRVRLSPAQCRDTFATTGGPVVIDRRLSLPARPSPAFAAGLSGRARAANFGPAVVCAFVEEEGSDRLFAVDGDTQVNVSRACTDATRRQAELTAALARTRRTLGQARRAAARAPRGRARRRARRRVRTLTRQATSLTRGLALAQRAVGPACA